MKRWLDIAIPSALLAGTLALQIVDPEPVQRLRNLVFDSYQRLAPRSYDPNLPVRILDIDEASLAALGQWPWPRSRLADIVEILTAEGAAAIALDIQLSEPDRTAPARLIELWQGEPALAEIEAVLAKLPDPDRRLAEALAAAPSLLALQLSPDEGAQPATPKAGFAIVGEGASDRAPAYPGAIEALSILVEAADGYGAINALPDADGIYRRVPMVFRQGEGLFPAFAGEALRVAQGASNFTLKTTGAQGELSFAGLGGIVAIKIGDFVLPTDETGALYLFDSGHRPERFLSARDLLAGRFDPALIAGHILLIGSSADGLKDIKATPLAATMAGVELNAQILEQAIAGQFLQRPDWAVGAERIFLGLFGIGLVLGARRLQSGGATALMLGAAAAAIGASWYAFASLGWLVDPVLPTASAGAIYLAAMTLGRLRSEQERRAVRSAFGQYLSPVLVEELTRHPERLTLGGEMRDLTIMFADIRGFTALSETLAPQELTKLINSVLTPMTDLIQKTGGTIDKYIGDCIMAFWNAPLALADHGDKAVEAALAIRAAEAELNRRRAEAAEHDGRPPIALDFCIGINSGRCSVGNMGSDQRFDYTAIGDAVNLASRLEGLTRAYDLDCLIGEATASACHAALLEVDWVRVKGRRNPVAIYLPMGDAGLKADSRFATLRAAHDAMLAAYRAQDWAAARSALAAAAKAAAERPDLALILPLYRVYDRRLSAYAESPPDKDWGGVFAPTGKSG